MNAMDTTRFDTALRTALAGLGLLFAVSFVLLFSSVASAQPAPAAQPAKTEISFMRFFGSCEAKYGTLTDPRQATGECGIITALTNRFNATNKDGIVVRTETAEWGPYYDSLNARLVAKDAPTISVMHLSVLGDYVRRKLVLPLDEGFKQAGVDTTDFTDHARQGVTRDGVVYALPFDTWSWLWHVNMNLMRKAGLVQPNGKPLLPRSPDELFQHAERFKAATGKPYFAWAVANETASHTRTFLTLVHQQGGSLFGADGRSMSVSGPEARTAFTLMKRLYDAGHIKPHADYGGASRAWLNGEAGIHVVGTWTIDQSIAESEKKDSPLYKGYHVVPFPQLYGKPSVFADGHAWVLMKHGAKNERELAAAFKFMKFLFDNDLEWARTGHLATRRSLVESPVFTDLPYRDDLAAIARIGAGIPGNVPVQRSVENLLGEEISGFMIGHKTLDQAIASIEKRINVSLRKARR